MTSRWVQKAFQFSPNSLLSSKQYSTYLQKCCTTSRSKYRAIPVATLLSKSWESAESHFTHSWESKLWVIFKVYFTFRRRTTFLKICRIFFGAQRRVWNALRKSLKPFASLFRDLLKIAWLHKNMWKFLLEFHLTP